MSAAQLCRECGARLVVMNGRGNRAHVAPNPEVDALIRRKRCLECGHEEHTIETPVADLRRLLRAYLQMDANN